MQFCNRFRYLARISGDISRMCPAMTASRSSGVMAIIILRCMAHVISGWSFDAIAAVGGGEAGAEPAAGAAEAAAGGADGAADCVCFCCELGLAAVFGPPVVATVEPPTVALTRGPGSTGAAQPASNVASSVARNDHCSGISSKANLAMMFSA